MLCIVHLALHGWTCVVNIGGILGISLVVSGLVILAEAHIDRVSTLVSKMLSTEFTKV